MEFIDTSTPGLHQYLQSAVPGYGTFAGGIQDFRDAAGYKDWLQMYVPNAFNAAMLNYQNEYNRPLNQMLRYQEAGVNPYAVVGNISASSAEGKSGTSSSYQGSAQWHNSIKNALSAVSTVAQVVGTAKEIYDYLKFGKEIRGNQVEQSYELLKQYQANASKAQSEADWALYWNYGEGMGPNAPAVQGSPRAEYMKQSTNEKVAHIGQLQSLVSTLYPNQSDQAAANAALNEFKKQVLEGQSNAILNINTGNKTADDILKLLFFWLFKQNL